MKKLHEIKIIYISKKKKKNPTREQVLEQEETEEFRDSLKTVSPTIGKDRLRIWKAWMDPITSQLSPSRGPPSSPEKHHRAPTRFTVCFHSKSKPGERPLERRSITRHNKHRCPLPSFPLCPRFVLFSPLFYRGWEEGIQPTMIAWIDDIWWWKTRSNHLNLTWNSNDNLFDRWIPQVSNQWE